MSTVEPFLGIGCGFFYVFTADRVTVSLEIQGDQEVIVIQEDRINKSVDQSLLNIPVIRIKITHFLQEKLDPFLGEFYSFREFIICECFFYYRFLAIQFLQTILNQVIRHSVFDRFY